jgi:hypothetical protein
MPDLNTDNMMHPFPVAVVVVVTLTACLLFDTSAHTSASMFCLHLRRYVSVLSVGECVTGFVGMGCRIIADDDDDVSAMLCVVERQVMYMSESVFSKRCYFYFTKLGLF